MKLSIGQAFGLLIFIIVLAVGAFFGVKQIKGKNNEARQAVFLTNGQVYFGYTKNENSKSVTLTDIYYLQVQEQLQSGATQAQKNQQPQVSLVKLGNELHGPQDEMRINREHILFIEDMKNDSKVNEAIANYIKNPTPAASPAAGQ